MKRGLCVILLFLLLILTGCGGLSESEIENAAEKYEAALQQLCDDYGLTDAKISISTDSDGDKIGDDICYFWTASVTSSQFAHLSGADAFSFVKGFDQLDREIFDYKNVSISFICHVNCGSGRYSYDTAYSNGNRLEYLMLYNNSVVTYRNGNMVYDIFND